MIDLQRLPDDLGIAAEVALPESVVENNDGLAAVLCIGWLEVAAEKRAHTKESPGILREVDTMHYFSFSLGQKCEFCHVAHHSDSDDKKPKHAARAMIAMVRTANIQTFKGKQEVRCYTCDAGYKKPLSRPMFPDEIRNDKDEPV